MTLVVWTNLTVSLENTFTAQDMMVKVLDQIYALSPLAGTTPATTNPVGVPASLVERWMTASTLR